MSDEVIRPVFEAHNPDLSNPGAEFLEWKIIQYLDKPHEFVGICPKEIPIQEDGWLDISSHGTTIFRGFVDKVVPQEDSTLSVTCYSLWKASEEVYSQAYEYPAATSINDMLSSDAPATGKPLGLLWLLNSAVIQGSFKLYSGETYYLDGANISERTKGKAVYVGSVKLTLGTSKDALQVGQYIYSGDHLYIRGPLGRDPKYDVVSITNYRDTRLRRGTIENGTFSFTVPYRISAKKPFRDLIEELIISLKLEMGFENRAPVGSEILGLSYLKASSQIGRGQYRKPVSEFKTDSVILLTKDTTAGERFCAIVGVGPGSGSGQVVAGKASLSSRGHWREKLYTTNLLGEMLNNSLDKIWSDTRDPRCWVGERLDDITLQPGDWVLISEDHQPNIYKRVKKITHRSDCIMLAEINQRILEPEDYMRARSQVVSTLQSFMSTQVTSWSSSFGPTNVDSGKYVANKEFSGSAKFQITVPSIDTQFPYRFFLKLDIAAYESSVTTVTTPNHAHGGSTGGHGGYSHGSTGNAGGDAHQVLQMTGYPSSSSSISVCTATNISVSSNTGDAGGHSHGRTTSYSSGNTGGGGVDSHSHSYTDSYVSAIASGGTHSHSYSFSGSLPYTMADPSGHTHTMPGHYTQATSTHPHSGSSAHGSNTRAVYDQGTMDNVMQLWKKMLETGNSVHYLKVYIKINNIQVSGSPYPDKYIGDSIEVDVTSLVKTGDNQIEVIIEDMSGASIPVRCAIRGSLMAEHYLYPFSQ